MSNKNELTQEQKEARAKEIAFKKMMNKVWKLRPFSVTGNHIDSKNLGKAPKCNVKVKQVVAPVMVNQKKKKGR